MVVYYCQVMEFGCEEHFFISLNDADTITSSHSSIIEGFVLNQTFKW